MENTCSTGVIILRVVFYGISGLFWAEGNRFAGKQYAASEVPATWSVARDSCHQDNATLAVITSAEYDSFLKDRFTTALST